MKNGDLKLTNEDYEKFKKLVNKLSSNYDDFKDTKMIMKAYEESSNNVSSALEGINNLQADNSKEIKNNSNDMQLKENDESSS